MNINDWDRYYESQDVSKFFLCFSHFKILKIWHVWMHNQTYVLKLHYAKFLLFILILRPKSFGDYVNSSAFSFLVLIQEVKFISLW